MKRIIWFALSASILVYLGVAFSFFGNPSATTMDLSLTLSITISAAVFFALLGYGASAFLSSDGRFVDFLAKISDADLLQRLRAVNQSKNGEQENYLKLFAEMDEADRRLVAVPVFLFVPFMVRLAINESIGVLGLVTTILSGDAQWSVPFAVVAILLNLRIFPRVEQMRERARRFHRVQV